MDFMTELGLQNFLPRGTITYSARNMSSTIDLVFTTMQLAEDMILCKVYECNHGSDHKAIHTKFQTSLFPAIPIPRLLFKNAPWAKYVNRLKPIHPRYAPTLTKLRNTLIRL